MNYQNFFRILICFFLIFSLLINISPIQAHATAITYTQSFVDTVNVIGAILVGLGVLPGTEETETFNAVVNSIISSLGLDKIISVVSWVSSGLRRYAAPQWLIEDIRDCLFSQSVVTTVKEARILFPAGTQFSTTDNGVIVLNGDYWCFAHRYGNLSSRTLVIVAPGYGRPSVTLGDGSIAGCQSSYMTGIGYIYYVALGISSSVVASSGLEVIQNDSSVSTTIKGFLAGEYDFSPVETITVSSGLVAGMIAGETLSFADGYATWASGAVSLTGADLGVETEEESDVATVYVPVAISQTYSETISQTQTEVQTGESTYVDTTESATTGLLGTIIGWLESIWSAICSIPASIVSAVQAVPDSIADVFIPSGEIDSYTIGLKDFFPFCIPYDLYDLFNVFVADPEIPYWELEFDFGELGTFPFTVDLSPWDDLAKIVRTIEVVVFCIGLALGTKKIIGW